MKSLKFLTLLPVVLLLAACGSKLNKGTIVDKYTKDPTPILIKSGGALIPISQDREYLIVIEGKNSDGKIVEEEREVSGREYRKIKIGEDWEDMAAEQD